jgi:hypothetical protein
VSAVLRVVKYKRVVEEVAPMLSPTDRAVVDAIGRRQASAETVAGELGLTIREVHMRLLGGVRVLAGMDAAGAPALEQIGVFLAWNGSQAERDHLAKELWLSGVDPLELDLLTRTLRSVGRRRAPALGGAVAHSVSA